MALADVEPGLFGNLRIFGPRKGFEGHVCWTTKRTMDMSSVSDEHLQSCSPEEVVSDEFVEMAECGGTSSRFDSTGEENGSAASGTGTKGRCYDRVYTTDSTAVQEDQRIG